MTEIIFASSFDNKFQPQNVFANNKEFWSTTGLLPQEIIIQFDAPRTISSASLSCFAVKKICIESFENDSAVNFVKQAEMIDIPFNESKLQEFSLTFSSNTKIKLLKVRIEEAYDDFCTIHNITFK